MPRGIKIWQGVAGRHIIVIAYKVLDPPRMSSSATRYVCTCPPPVAPSYSPPCTPVTANKDKYKDLFWALKVSSTTRSPGPDHCLTATGKTGWGQQLRTSLIPSGLCKQSPGAHQGYRELSLHLCSRPMRRSAVSGWVQSYWLLFLRTLPTGRCCRAASPSTDQSNILPSLLHSTSS